MRYIGVFVALMVGGNVMAQDRQPWEPRQRQGVVPNLKASIRVSPHAWPVEPSRPEVIDILRFARSIRDLCKQLSTKEAVSYATWTVRYSEEFSQDPFLVAALMFRMGRCYPQADNLSGLGMTSIPLKMYASNVSNNHLIFSVLGKRGWSQKSQDISRFSFGRKALKNAESNIYFAAAILAAWEAQHRSVDRAFEQQPHRHFVSHFIWGDSVLSSRAEDRILTSRRRLLQYYGAFTPRGAKLRRGILVTSPLDGAPRVISSFPGEKRSGGKRKHRGIDFESVRGEPVRAAADGTVTFSGVDLPGPGSSLFSTLQTRRRRAKRMGPGGQFICISHEPGKEDPLTTCYMHLDRVFVLRHQEVKRGTVIGTVGRTGIKHSAPHLHFEVRKGRRMAGPADFVAPWVVNPRAQ